MGDYNARNCEALRRWGARQAVRVPVSYMPELTCIESASVQDIDVLFYGLLNEPRKQVLEEPQAAGLRVQALVGICSAARDRYVARAKVVLNMHPYATRVFDIARVASAHQNICDMCARPVFPRAWRNSTRP